MRSIRLHVAHRRLVRMAAPFAMVSMLLGAASGLHWDATDLAALERAIGDARREGLDPADYDASSLKRARNGGNAAFIDQVATAKALRLAGDYLQGRVRGGARVDWHIPGPVASDAVLKPLLADALRGDRIEAMLAGLLPHHPDYRALRNALVATAPEDVGRIRQLRVNMERWRWMPRDLGRRYVLVNVPGFSLKLFDGDAVLDERAVIVGKLRTPTPQFATAATAVILNPWWDVPPSIVREGIGALVRGNPARARAQGYVAARAPGGGVRIRQGPGDRNALGRMKLVMPNPYNVYLHDTPNKTAFDKPMRILSHGCVRVKNAIDFATLLLEGNSGWTREQVDRVLTSRTTTRVALYQPVPIWVGYFTVATDAKGALAFHTDPYERDAPVWNVLNARRKTQLAMAGREGGRCVA